MSTKPTRGTKRTCQSNECGARFYDLDRDPITCPICGSIYELAHSPLGYVAPEEKAPRKARKVDVPSKVAPVEAAEAETEAEDTLADIETDDGDEIATVADETFLEEEEEGGDVTNIIGGPVEGDEEP